VNPLTLAWTLLIVAGANSCIGNLLLKQSRLVAVDGGLVEMMFSPWFIGGCAFYGVNVILFAKAMDHLPVNVAYPVLAGANFAFLAVGSAIVFGERLGWMQGLGVAVIGLGIVLVASQ
jgi:multidrug transporter EmrE-like cation transporter